MSFYKCTVVVRGKPCGVGIDSARQCGVNPCKHLVAHCDDHGGDASAVHWIREHMREAHGRKDL